MVELENTETVYGNELTLPDTPDFFEKQPIYSKTSIQQSTMESKMENKMENLSLTLTEQENDMENIRCYEPVDENKLDRLIHGGLLKTVIKPRSFGMTHQYHNEKAMLTKYKEKRFSRDLMEVVYTRGKRRMGRVNPEGSLSIGCFRRAIRHSLVGDTMVDIDIENCHPSILVQYCEANGVACDALREYVSNRQHWLDLVMTEYAVGRDEAKLLFILLLYGGSFKGWVKAVAEDGFVITKPIHSSLNDFRSEFKVICKAICDANPEIVAYCQDKYGEQAYILGKVVSLFNQEIEVRVLEKVYVYMNERRHIKHSRCVLCYDGIMIEKDYYKEGLCEELTRHIQETLGLHLTFTTKAMDMGWTDKEINDAIQWDIFDFTTGNLADYFKMIHGGKFVNYRGQLYHYNGTFWATEIDNSTILNFIDKDFHKIMVGLAMKKMEEAKEAPESEREKADAILKQCQILLGKIPKLRDISFKRNLLGDIMTKIADHDIIWNAHPDYFAFTNVIINLKTREAVKPNPKLYISQTATYAYIQKPSSMRRELEAILVQIMPNEEERNYVLTFMATGLIGVQIQQFLSLMGVGGNGKSMLISLMTKAVGDYGVKLAGDLVCKAINADGANVGLASLDMKRFVFIEEPKKKLCASTIKDLTGSPTLTARGLYDPNMNKRLMNTLLFATNSQLEFDTEEITRGEARRMTCMPMKAKFCNRADYESFQETDEFKSGLIHLANEEYMREDWQHDYKQPFFDILTGYLKQYYETGMPNPPASGAEMTKKWLCDSDAIYAWFDGAYEKDEGELIGIKELFDAFKASQTYYDMTKAQKKGLSTEKKFKEKVEENMFLGKYYKKRNQRHNGVQLTKDHIVGWKRKVEEA